jgi:hypothetical protein
MLACLRAVFGPGSALRTIGIPLSEEEDGEVLEGMLGKWFRRWKTLDALCVDDE